MRTVQSRSSMRFTTEPLLEHLVAGNLGRQNLDRDDPVDDGVVGTPHLAHAASSQQLDQPVVSERLSLQRAPPCSTFSALSSLHEKLSRLTDSRDQRRGAATRLFSGRDPSSPAEESGLTVAPTRQP